MLSCDTIKSICDRHDNAVNECKSNYDPEVLISTLNAIREDAPTHALTHTVQCHTVRISDIIPHGRKNNPVMLSLHHNSRRSVEMAVRYMVYARWDMMQTYIDENNLAAFFRTLDEFTLYILLHHVNNVTRGKDETYNPITVSECRKLFYKKIHDDFISMGEKKFTFSIFRADGRRAFNKSTNHNRKPVKSLIPELTEMWRENHDNKPTYKEFAEYASLWTGRNITYDTVKRTALKFGYKDYFNIRVCGSGHEDGGSRTSGHV